MKVYKITVRHEVTNLNYSYLLDSVSILASSPNEALERYLKEYKPILEKNDIIFIK